MAIKVAFFDMDGTLISENSWDMIYKSLGLESSPYLNDYLNGKISYRELVYLDVSYWARSGKPATKEMIESLARKVTVKEEAKEVIRRLKALGIRSVMVTAGLYEFAERVKLELGLDKAFSNRLVYDERGMIRDAVIEVEPLKKNLILRAYMKENNIKREESIAVGDTVYDNSMFRETLYGFLLAKEPLDPPGSNVIVVRSLKEILNYLEKSS